MAESKASIKAGCKKVCQELASREQAWLDSFYDQKHRSIKEKETVELVQHTIDLPLQAQERVQEFFTKQGVAYVSTAWRELSAQLPKLDYEYIDWSWRTTDQMDSGMRNRSDKGLKKDIRKLPSLTVQVGGKELINTQKRGMEGNGNRREEELSRRIRGVKKRNTDRVDIWCKELEKLMASVLEKYLPLK